jgi:RNA polymerase sigma-70 factor (ECF subfamily)
VGTVRSRVARARTSLFEWLGEAERCTPVAAAA